MMGIKQRLKSGEEYDFIYARGQYCYLVNNAKLKKRIKKRMSRRRRKENKESSWYMQS